MPAARNASRNALRQPLLLCLAIGVQPGAIGAFQHEQIGMRQPGQGCAQHRALRGDTHIPGDHHCSIGSRKPQADRAGHMPGAGGLHRDLWQLGQRELLPHRQRTYLAQHACHQRFRVQRRL